jgi:4-hydroxybenzoyl-CoA thioesterase
MADVFVRDKRVRFQHCDPAGIVFYPQYFVMIHELMEDWFTEALGRITPRWCATRASACPR